MDRCMLCNQENRTDGKFCFRCVNEIEPGIAKRRGKWIVENSTHEGHDCLLYPFNVNIGQTEYIHVEGRRSSMSAGPLMCTLAHGPRPEGKRFVITDCAGRYDGCINPNHIRWGDGTERSEVNKKWKAILFGD